MTYLPGGRINATIGGNTAGVGALLSTGTITLAGGNNVTLSQNGNAITISGAAGGAAGTNTLGISNLGNSVGTSGVISGTGLQLALAGGNNVTLSQSINGSSATITVSAFNQSNQTVGLYALGNTTQNSSTALDARTLSFNGLGGASVGYSNGSIQISAPQTVAQTNQTVGLYALGNTTQNSSSTRDARSLSFNGLGGITVGYSNGSIQLSGPQTAAQTNQTIGLYALGNTTQNSSTSLDARTLSFNGLGAATMGYSNGSIQVSVPVQTAQTQSNIQAVYDGANSISTGTIRFSNSNGVSFGVNGQTITASHNGITSQSVQTQNVHNVTFSGNTAGVMAHISSGTMTLAGGNNITVSQNGNAVSIIGGAGAAAGTNTLGMSNLGNTSGTTGVISGTGLQLAFAGGNNITLSQSINASSATITISAGNGGAGGGIAMANSETTFSTGTVNMLEGGGAITIASSAGGQSFKLSVPQTSSLSATGLVSISTNGSTINIGVPYDTMDFYQNMDRGTSASIATANGTLMLQRLNQENNKFAANITANTLLLNMTANMTATSLSSSHSMSAYVAVYSDNATVLTLINSASTSWAIGAATGNTASYHGPRWLSFVSSQWSSAPVFTQGGDYVFGVFFRSSNYNPPMSYMGQNYMASAQRSGTMGTSVGTNTSLAQGNYWNAMYSASTTAFPTAISASQVNRNNATAIFIPHVILNNRYSGTF